MTAYQKAIAIFVEYGLLEPAKFGPLMFPTLYRTMDSTAFTTAVGDFLAGMVRQGLAKKVGRRYGVKDWHFREPTSA